MKAPALGLALAFAAIVGLAANIASAADVGVVANEAAARDFMIQNVCLDSAGAVVIGVAPVSGDPRCAGQRDLRPGEKLPYHKHDHPSPDQQRDAPAGYQRHDSFPVETTALGTVVEHSFDFGVVEGRRFGVFDRNGDGGDIAVLSPGEISIGATEDGGGGFSWWIGECQGVPTAAALRRSWLIAEYDPARPAPFAGETIARLTGLKEGRGACPSHFSAAYTRWRVAPFRYRTGEGQGTPVTLTTLISDHYGGAVPATADHVERFYFTRELGGTRWERWQNAGGNARYSAAKVAEAAAWFAGTKRCSAAEPPYGGAPMVLIDCREWTLIEPPADPAGDPPGFFIGAIRGRGDAGFFAPP